MMMSAFLHVPSKYSTPLIVVGRDEVVKLQLTDHCFHCHLLSWSIEASLSIPSLESSCGMTRLLYVLCEVTQVEHLGRWLS